MNNLYEQERLIETSKAMMKRFQRIKKEKEKQNKLEYTWEQFAELIRKESEQRDRVEKFTFVVLVAILLYSIVSHVIKSGIISGIVYGIILAVIAGAIYLGHVRTERKNMQMQIRILQECEEKHITIEEYIEMCYEE